MRLPAGYARLVSSLIARGPAATRFGVTLRLVGRSRSLIIRAIWPEDGFFHSEPRQAPSHWEAIMAKPLTNLGLVWPIAIYWPSLTTPNQTTMEMTAKARRRCRLRLRSCHDQVSALPSWS